MLVIKLSQNLLFKYYLNIMLAFATRCIENDHSVFVLQSVGHVLERATPLISFSLENKLGILFIQLSLSILAIKYKLNSGCC